MYSVYIFRMNLKLYLFMQIYFYIILVFNYLFIYFFIHYFSFQNRLNICKKKSCIHEYIVIILSINEFQFQ